MKSKLWILVVFLLSCNIDVNTSDALASQSSSYSRTNNLYLGSYFLTKSDSSCAKIREAWIEYSWKNEASGNDIVKHKLGGVQLVLNVIPSLSKYTLNNYLLEWELKDSTFGVFSQLSNVQFLGLENKPIPREFKIHLIQLKDASEKGGKEICSFSLTKNN